MATLVEQVRAKDFSATLTARAQGAAQAGALVRLASDADAEVRELALLCLVEVGGPDAERTFAIALLDRNGQARSAAMRGALRHSTAASAPSLLNAYDHSGEEVVRECVLQVLGALPGTEIASVKKRWEREKLPRAREAGLAAPARLGDPLAREEFAKALAAAPSPDRGRWIERARYVGAKWVLKPLEAWLDDTSDSLRIGADNFAACPMYLRVCDLVVNLAAELGGHAFRFTPEKNVQYSPGQVQEVREFLRSLP